MHIRSFLKNGYSNFTDSIYIIVFMNRILVYEINKIDEGMTIRSFLRSKRYSKQCLSYLMNHENSVLLNDEEVYLITPLKEGDKLEITFTDDPNPDLIASPIPLDIIYEDEDIIVINKQAGLPVHPSNNHLDNSLANALAFYLHDDSFVFRCINRLDKDTSGITVVAKNLYSSAVLHDDMIKRNIKRYYLAAVKGDFPYEKGTIDAPIKRVGESMIRTVDFENGERAVTHYEKIGFFPNNDISLLELTLDTGKTHQIRVHMKYMGFPLVGDRIYNPDSNMLSRQALHAYRICFDHPVSGKPLIFETDIPEDIKSILF